MTKLLALVGATALGWVGWAIGMPFGFVGAFLMSMVGTGVGMYYGAKLGRYYGG